MGIIPPEFSDSQIGLEEPPVGDIYEEGISIMNLWGYHVIHDGHVALEPYDEGWKPSTEFLDDLKSYIFWKIKGTQPILSTASSITYNVDRNKKTVQEFTRPQEPPPTNAGHMREKYAAAFSALGYKVLGVQSKDFIANAPDPALESGFERILCKVFEKQVRRMQHALKHTVKQQRSVSQHQPKLPERHHAA